MIEVCLFELALRRHLAEIIACRFELENERMRMSRLSEKLERARGVVGRQTAKIEARADAILAQEPLLEKQTDDAFAGHEAMLSEAQKGLDALKRELALVSNDPLESSGESLEELKEAWQKDISPVRVLPDGPAGVGDLNLPKADRVALGPHPDQPSKLEQDAKALDLEPHVYRKFEAGMPLETAKAVNGS
jgi:hypothetical protein